VLLRICISFKKRCAGRSVAEAMTPTQTIPHEAGSGVPMFLAAVLMRRSAPNRNRRSQNIIGAALVRVIGFDRRRQFERQYRDQYPMPPAVIDARDYASTRGGIDLPDGWTDEYEAGQSLGVLIYGQIDVLSVT
jgi:hypothetical protein